MKTNCCSRRGKDGVALVIVLGMLAVLTVLGVAFAIAMRIERIAAWNHANSIRAEGLVMAGVEMAMGDVNVSVAGTCYPNWTNRPAGRADAMGSETGKSSLQMTNILGGEAIRAVPASLYTDARDVALNHLYWTNVVINGRTNGRVAYLVVNASGLVDASLAGGQKPFWRTNIAEIDVSNLLSVTYSGYKNTTKDFSARRVFHRRYETVPEIAALNNTVDPNKGCFFPYSFDVGRDQAPLDIINNLPPIHFGVTNIILGDKFDLNSITKYPSYNMPWDMIAYQKDAMFMSNYYARLVEILKTPRLGSAAFMVERPNDVACNIIGYLDPDRIPQGILDDPNGNPVTDPWTKTEGGEAIPLINEIVLQKTVPDKDPDNPVISNRYEFAVEYWYPFAPTMVQPKDRFFSQICVFTNNWGNPKNIAGIPAPPSQLTITNYAAQKFSFRFDISNMVYATPTEFLCITSPLTKKISFPVPALQSNGTVIINYLPIGIQQYKAWNGAKYVTNTVTNCVWFLGRTYKTENVDNDYEKEEREIPVDEAMGYKEAQEKSQTGTRMLKKFDATHGYSVADPRSNGQIKYWENSVVTEGLDYPAGGVDQTLGTTNKNCNPWSRKGSGVPIYGTNGPMENIGELGYIYRSNLDDEQPTGYKWWRTINLMHYDEGAALLDLCTVRQTNMPARGLFCINSRQPDAMYTLFNNMAVGYESGPRTNFYKIDNSGFDSKGKAYNGPFWCSNLVSTIISNGPYISFRSLFTADDSDDGGGGPNAQAFRMCGTNAARQIGDIYGEDPFRRICELISFRQNLFVVIVAAQVVGGDGATVVAERRGAAIVCRDSYSGRYFVRSFKWLSDRS